MLYIDVTKVYQVVAHVVIAIHVCIKCKFQMFHTLICSIRMFLVFYFNVAKLDLDVAYTCMLQAYVSSVIRCFIWTLHMFAMVFKCF